MVPVDHMVNSVPCKVQKWEIWAGLGKYHEDKQNKYWANHIECRLPENFGLQTIAYSIFFYKPDFSKQIFGQKLWNRLVKTFGQITGSGLVNILFGLD